MMKRSFFRPVHAIVPVKVPGKSKMRLSRRLNEVERTSLTISMLINVLTALRRAKSVASLTVVCADRRLRLLVEECGASFLWEGHPRGLNRALNFALRRIPSGSPILIIHADLPFLTPEDVDNLIMRAQGYPLAFVPSKDRTGTNALLMQSPNLIKLAFGKGSFGKHIMQSKKAKIRHESFRIYGVAFDVDEEEDLDELIRWEVEKEELKFLQEKLITESKKKVLSLTAPAPIT